MPAIINIPSAMVTNALGIIVLFTILLANSWRLKRPSKEDGVMLSMIIIVFISCIADPIAFFADGKSGLIWRILVITTNTWLYMANIMIVCAGLLLVCIHLGYKPSKMHMSLVLSICILLCVLLIINIFVPLVFNVSKDNVYTRLPMFWVFFGVQLGVALDLLAIYFHVRKRSGNLMLFPVWAFLVPAIFGIAIQAVIYGLSTIYPFYAVSIACIASSLQNEMLFRDMLTGLFNRFYISTLEKRMQKRKHIEYTAMMLDINGFKSINDTYGHKTGDIALKELAQTLKSVVKTQGVVIRYAGDEFIIIINTQQDDETERIIAEIHRALAARNTTEAAPFKLSVSVGHMKLRLNENDMDDYLNKIDRLMYDNKREFYTHSKVGLNDK